MMSTGLFLFRILKSLVNVDLQNTQNPKCNNDNMHVK